MAKKHDSAKAYNALFGRLKETVGRAKAMALGIGGNFESIGLIERELLIMHGLKPNDYLIDVGCGSGRLSQQLSGWLKGKYLGTDVVAEFLDNAVVVTDRPDWRFELVDRIHIPESEARADMVCFFSVLTHIPHEQSYHYLIEARRVLKPGGLLVFTFLEFAVEEHWGPFEESVASAFTDNPINVFIGRDAVDAWARHLGFDIVSVTAGDEVRVPIPHRLTYDDGSSVEGFAKLGPLGQSVAVWRKK